MEKFKVIERETKTKAFSKEGLALAAKVDPRDKERNAVRDWLNECVDALKLQIDQAEAEIEAGSSKKKKSRTTEKETMLTTRIERHNYHIGKLEQLMRAVDNKTVEDLDKQIKEDLEEEVNYYIAENADEDFAENEYLYEDFDELLADAGSTGTIDQTAARREAEAAAEKLAAEKEAKLRVLKEKQDKLKREKEKEEARKKAEKLKVQKAKEAAAAKHGKGKSGPDAGSPFVPPPAQAKLATGINFAAAAGASAQNNNPPPAPKPAPAPAPQAAAAAVRPQPAPAPAPAPAPVRVPPTAGSTPTAAGSTPPAAVQAPPQAQAQAAAQQDLNQVARSSIHLLSTSGQLLPEQQEQSRSYTPTTPHASPACYPQHPPSHFSQPAFFATLDTDTLLFIFYYQQGTYQQYLAARELKKQAWRFHKRYLTWFQRHEEPKVRRPRGLLLLAPRGTHGQLCLLHGRAGLRPAAEPCLLSGLVGL